MGSEVAPMLRGIGGLWVAVALSEWIQQEIPGRSSATPLNVLFDAFQWAVKYGSPVLVIGVFVLVFLEGEDRREVARELFSGGAALIVAWLAVGLIQAAGGWPHSWGVAFLLIAASLLTDTFHRFSGPPASTGTPLSGPPA